MTRSPGFDNGLGLDVHTRTSIVFEAWSLISDAAIRIGNDTFEVSNQGITYVNGVERSDYPFTLAGKYPVTKYIEIVKGATNNEWNEKFETKEEQQQDERIHYLIDLKSRSDHNNTDRSSNEILINIYRTMISVRVDAYMADAEGMLGVHDAKGMVGRDHQTIYQDAVDMGSAWQVRDTDPDLFINGGTVTFPEQCIVPTKPVASQTQRRLRSSVEDDEKYQQAKIACAKVSSDMYSFCIEDVLRTGDISMAHGFAF
jgi:hypothetical protein